MARDLPITPRLAGVSLLALALWAPGCVSASDPGAVAVQRASQPAFSCEDSGALRVRCQGSFDDGTSAAGITVRVLDKHNRPVVDGKVDVHGRFSFRKPDAEFCVVFDAGQGRTLTVAAATII